MTNRSSTPSSTGPSQQDHDRTLRRTALGQQVRDALTHLYDLPHLHAHPLAQRLPRPAGARSAPGHLLQQRLLAAIDALRPDPSTPPTLRAGRYHRLFTLRYVEGLDLAEVCSRLGISQTEYYREHGRGLEAVIAALAPDLSLGASLDGAREEALATPVVGAVGGSGPLGRLPARTPLVGRAEDLALLQDQFAAAGSGQGGRLVLLSGDPGVGKTRLVQELGNAARLQGGAFLQGRYLREGTTPYLPWVEALRSRLQGLSREDLAAVIGPYGAPLTQIFPELAEQAGPFPPSPPLAPEEQRLRLYDGLTHLLLHLSQSGPLVLLLDDLQWAPGLALLTHMARRLSESRALLVGAYREQEFREQPALLREWAELHRARLFVPLSLKPLGEEATGQMVAHYFGEGVAAALREPVYQTTKGNPFFVEEVVRTLAESGAVRPGEDGWEVVEAGHIALPESIRLLVEERVARLGDGAREMLGQAAVLGQEFSFGVLQAMTGLEEGALVEQVERTVAARLLVDRSVRGGERYGFLDDQVQEALYSGISSVRRRRWHQRAGIAIEQVEAGRLEGQVEELARHFVEGNDLEKGADYSYRAGLRADRLYAWPRAISSYRTALELWQEVGGHLEQRADVCEKLGDACFKSTIDAPSGITYLEQALALYEELGNRRKQATLHSQIGREYSASANLAVRDLEKTVASLHRARVLLEAEGDSLPLGIVYASLAGVNNQLLAWDEAITWSNEAVTLGERLKRPVLIFSAVAMGYAWSQMAEVAKGLAQVERSWQLAIEHGLAFQADQVRWQGTSLHMWLKHPRAALSWAARQPDFKTTSSRLLLPSTLLEVHALLGELAQGRKLLDTYQAQLDAWQQQGLATMPYNQGLMLLYQGEWSQARRMLEDGLQWSRSAHLRATSVRTAATLSRVFMETGEYALAEEHLRWAMDVCKDSRSALFALNLLSHLCELYVKTGRLEQADVHLREAQAILANGEDWCGLVGDVALAEGLIRAAQGRWEEAEGAFQRAMDVYRQYELRWDEAKAQYEWGCALTEQGEEEGTGNKDRARELLGTAGLLWEQMGAGPYAERCRQELEELG